MEFIEGRTLAEELKAHGAMDETAIRAWLWPVMEGLQVVHDAGYLHRDIKPHNIMMRHDGRPVLLDFGAARAAIGGRTRSLTAIMTPGYAPLEQYETKGNQGPWTDIYALAAVIYCCISCQKPPDVMDRFRDDALEPPDSKSEFTYSRAFIRAVSVALALREEDRPQSLLAWLKMLDGEREKPTRKMLAKLHRQPGPVLETRKYPPQSNYRGARKWLLVSLPVLMLFVVIWIWLKPDKPESAGDPPEGVTQPLQKPIGQPVRQTTTQAAADSPAPQTEEVESQGVPSVQATQATGSLVISTNPPGATIAIDGESVGISPLSLKRLSAAEAISVTAFLDGYEGITRSVELETERETWLQWDLVGRGSLTVITDPPDARIRILNIKPSYRDGIQLPPGLYEVEVTMEGYDPWRNWVRVGEGSTEITATIEASSRTVPGPEFSNTTAVALPDQTPVVTPLQMEDEESPKPAGPIFRWIDQFGLTRHAESLPEEIAGKAYDILNSEGIVIKQIRAAPVEQQEFIAGRAFRDCANCPEMVVIPEGSFRMGSSPNEQGQSSAEGPVHQVAISLFAIGKYEITIRQFEHFVLDTGYRTDAENNTGGNDGCHTQDASADFTWSTRSNYRNTGWDQTPDLPVVCISWYDARAYVNWLAHLTGRQYRLPSEAELEYVNRAGERGRFPWGNSEQLACGTANGADQDAKKQFATWAALPCSDGYVFTSPAGSFRGNALGLHDLSGNVWEWSEDCWHENYGGAPTDGSAWSSGDCSRRALRGGSFRDASAGLRSAYRKMAPSLYRGGDTGFRVALHPPR
jgi:formylglycine-generating enzyme required for sulfatase activity/serine/threonine protein kinase